MSIRFDENASNFLNPGNNDAFHLPNADWCLCFWEATSDNTGTAFQYLVSHDVVGTSPSINLYFAEASATDANKLFFNICPNGSGGANIFNVTNAVTGVLTFDGTPRLWVCQRVSDTYEIKYATAYSNTINTERVNSSPSPSVLAAISPANTHRIGARQDGNTARAYGGDMGHYFQGDFSLTDSEIIALASGKTIFELGKTPNFYLHMQENVAAPPDLMGVLTVSRNGTLATGIAFPPDIRGFMGAVLFTPAAETISGMRGYSGYATRPYSAPVDVVAGGGGGGGLLIPIAAYHYNHHLR